MITAGLVFVGVVAGFVLGVVAIYHLSKFAGPMF